MAVAGRHAGCPENGVACEEAETAGDVEREGAAGPKDAGVGRPEEVRAVAAESAGLELEHGADEMATSLEDTGVGSPEEVRVVAAEPAEA